jgi:PKD repeat protein
LGTTPISITFCDLLNSNGEHIAHDTHDGTVSVSLPPPPLSVSISPLSASILVGQPVTFTSTVSGGYPPYSYQWYLNGVPVSGATSNTWTFTPTTSGIYYVHLKVTDAKGNTAQSETARITAATVPVGGYSFPIQVQTKTEPIIPYIALIAILTAVFTKLRPKTKRKH